APLVCRQQLDRMRDVVGVALDQLTQPEAFEILLAVRLEMQDHRRALHVALGRLDAEALSGVRAPAKRRLASRRPADDLDAIGDQEGAVEADAKLTDQLRSLAGLFPLRRLQRLHELARPGARQRAQVVLQLLR